MADSAVGTLETKAEVVDGPEPDAGLVRYWLDAIDIASKEEKPWRDQAKKVIDLYRAQEGASRQGKPPKFPILYSNIQTIGPAVYNSAPTPDIRRAFNDRDADAKAVSDAMERTLSRNLDRYDFHDTMKAAVHDMLLPGRGVVRVRWKPEETPTGVVDHRVYCETVQWDDFRRGPGKRWTDVTWVAFRHRLTRDQLRKLSPECADEIGLDVEVEGASDRKDGAKSGANPDIMKRATVWEVWDKEAREIVFIAANYADKPLKVEADIYELEGFFPIPRPLYAVSTTDSLVPIEEFRLYEEQAKELERISARILAIVRVLKWRGIYAGEQAGAMAQLAKADDGELVPSEHAMAFAEKGLAASIWLWPVEQAVKVLGQLYQAREQTKQVIYEIMGISDILRGSSVASETATAQKLKGQWGSLRLSDRQGEVARFARDLFRIMAEIIATKFDPMAVQMASGVQLTPPQVAMMQSDVMRDYRIDIETDSTIQADTERTQKHMAEFVQGVGTFLQSLGPAVQSGDIPKDVAADLLKAFGRAYKLGRTADDAWERLGEQAQQPQEEKPDPRIEIEKAKLDMDAQRLKMDMAAAEQKAKMEATTAQLDQQRAEEKHGMEMQMMQAKAGVEMQKAQLDMSGMQAEHEHAAMTRESEAPVQGGIQSVLAGFQELLANQVQLTQQQAQAAAMQQQAAVAEREAMTQIMTTMMAALKQIAAPKRVVRHPQTGRVEGVEPMMVQ